MVPNMLTQSHKLLEPVLCRHCGAKQFQYESKGFCCSNGEIVLKNNVVPGVLYDLFVSSDEAREVKRCSRIYNSNFAFTSLGVNCDDALSSMSRGVYTFRIQGQVYHRINQLLPIDKPPSFFQLSFYDTEHELQNRLNFSDQMTSSLVQKIIDALQVNPYCQFFRSRKDVPNLPTKEIQIKRDAGLDQRVYNAPTASQVAAILIDRGRTDGQPIHDYPLLFPYGDAGWHSGIQRNGNERRPSTYGSVDTCAAHVESIASLLAAENALEINQRSSVSCREYYCYKLQIRPAQTSLLLHAGRLFQQYIVDMYVKIETTRLDYFRLNQLEIRADLYQGIVDSVQVGQTRAADVGRRVILPASFIGGPRDMKRRYMDAMALVQKFGKPNIFLTIICNPNWPEIKEELSDNELAQDRPDLLARIFRAKLEELKKDLIKREFFGPVAAYVYVIEFQKRGLPHAHFLLILKAATKMVVPESYDNVVTAEIPDPHQLPWLHSLVARHMMHGPCGYLNPKNVCMKKNGCCKNSYPKPFCSATQNGDDSYPNYRRRNDGRTIKVLGQHLNNRWVVPYNPELLVKFDCHLNVEICCSIKAVKYLYKYVYKGHDKVFFSINASGAGNPSLNEIDNFQSARWISPPEAAWRIFAFVLSQINPHVISLQLHLPDSQLITFRGDEDLASVLDNDAMKATMLNEFFYMNTIDPKARTLLYREEFPEHFVWKKRDKTWTHRKKFGGVGRIVAANPLEGERYYLHLLLSHVRGATSFDHLKSVGGAIAQTFQEACLLLGLLGQDDSSEACLKEAALYSMPFALRRLFATILAYSSPRDPRSLWQAFKDPMCEDYLKKNDDPLTAERAALQSVNSFLEPLGKNVNNYALVSYHVTSEMEEDVTNVIDEELYIDVSDNDLLAIDNLNTMQKHAFELILSELFADRAGLFFIDGPGGTGKTFLYRALLAAVRSNKIVALAVASSGVAAGILPGGRTAHSRFKIPLQIDGNSVCPVSKQSGLAQLFRITKLIIWDEAPMVHRDALEAVDRMLLDVTGSSLPFGGKVVVLGGDFRQILPVVRKGSKKEIINASLMRSYLWGHCTKIKLVENMRAKSDPAFSDYLESVME